MKRIVTTMLLLCVGCAAESSSPDRKSSTSSNADAGTDATTEAATADPNDGRDEDPASCYAVCSNTSFTCGTSLVANLSPNERGCTGTIGSASDTTSTKPLVLDCGARTVCIDGACVSGSFSAFAFSYTPAGGEKTVCTRD